MAFVLSLGLALSLAGCGTTPPPPGGDDFVVDPTEGNERVFYQIFVGSFSDSNGDGVGDLRGIIDRLDYQNDWDIK